MLTLSKVCILTYSLLRSLDAAIANRNITYRGNKNAHNLSLISKTEETGVLFPYFDKILL